MFSALSPVVDEKRVGQFGAEGLYPIRHAEGPRGHRKEHIGGKHEIYNSQQPIL
jgi:hypothetical protein